MSDPKESKEQRAAVALARALDGEMAAEKGDTIDDPEVVELLSLANRVRASVGHVEPLHPSRRDEIIGEALERGRGGVKPRRRGTLYVIGGALAAAIVLLVLGFIGRDIQRNPGSSDSQLMAEALAGPTDELFDGPFPEDQSPADRMDRIVRARTRGYFSALILARSAPPVASASIIGGASEDRGNRWGQ